MSYHHLTISERESILELQARGHSMRAIAVRLKRNVSTISREFGRMTSKYSPAKAQESYRERRRQCHKPHILSQQTELRQLIIRLILEHQWSPEQIEGRLKHEGFSCVSYATIYRYIESHNLELPFSSKGDTGIRRNLRHRGRKRHFKNTRRHAQPKVDYIPIAERPKFINERQRIGDWEIDTVLGKTGGAVLVTAVERRTRFTLINWAAKKSSEYVNQAILAMLDGIPKEFRLSLTPDHGTEFLQLSQIAERLGVTVYWPDPYSPEQRGTNENTNGLIREYFPKNREIKKDVEDCQNRLNQRPRKIL
ncbi:IS30 family transposase, partial [uncultured Secundilactobacillus sp.]|uniref:IS30 family transposase n=1 Tax=uncultured Secundilactobacillus sp. TaxID=2813935 RepID=UPI00258F1A4E